MTTAFQSNAFQTTPLAWQIDSSPTPPPFGRSGLGGDDVPRYLKSPHRGWNREEWKKRVKDGEDGVASTLQATYDKLIGREPALSVLAQIDAIVRPVAKQESRDVPIRIDWQRMAEDFERANRLMALAREESDLQAFMEDEDEVLMLIQ